MPASSTQQTKAQQAGRGLIAIAGSKIYFIITSYAIQLSLPRIFGAPEEFGLYTTVMSGLAMLNNVLIVATIQTVSKFTSEEEEHAPQILRQGLALQAALGAALAGAIYAGAPGLAEFLYDPQLTDLIRLMSAVVLAYALYAALIGNLNGRRLFVRQAGLDATFSTLRSVGIIGGATLGIGAFGAVAGFTTAALTILLIAVLLIGAGRPGEHLPLKRWAAFMAPIWLYQGCLNGVLQVDVQVLKRTVAEMAWARPDLLMAAADVANQKVGFYRAAQTFAFVPYQLIIALTFIVFPLVSKATSAGDLEATKQAIRTAFRISLLVLLAVAAPVAGAADGVLRIAYPVSYLVGASALEILVLGVVAFALFVVAGTIISSAGRPGVSAAIAVIAVLVVLVATRLLIVRAGLQGDVLRATALGTSIGMGAACLAASLFVWQRFGALLAGGTALRAALAAVCAYFAAAYVPHDTRMMALAALAAGFFVFVIVLLVTREIRREDLALIRRSM